jgi:uncharacterized protein
MNLSNNQGGSMPATTDNPVVWFEIYVNDMPRAKAFYEAVLNVKLDRLPTPEPDIEMWAFPMKMNGSGASGGLAKMKGFPAGTGGSIVYFASEDCANEVSRVKTNGGSVVKDKHSIGQYGFIALATDTEGNMIGFHSQR